MNAWDWAWAAHGMIVADVEVLAQYNGQPDEWKADKPHLAHVMGMKQIRFNLAVRAGRLDEDWVPLHGHNVWVRPLNGEPVPYGAWS